MKLALPPLAGGATRLILLRHGEPDEAVRGCCYGRLDPCLSPAGRDQMRLTWRFLAGYPAAPTYSSPRGRALESAGLRPATRTPVRIEDELREIDFGDIEGLSYREIEMRYPNLYADWMARPTEVTFPGGESFNMMAARVRTALDRIRHACAGETAVIVSHGGVNRVALAAALALEPRHIFRLAQAYACVNVIDYLGDHPIVRVMNATVEERREGVPAGRVPC